MKSIQTVSRMLFKYGEQRYVRCGIATRHFVAQPDWAEYAVYYKDNGWYYLLLDGQGKRMTKYINTVDAEYTWIDMNPPQVGKHQRFLRMEREHKAKMVDNYYNNCYSVESI